MCKKVVDSIVREIFNVLDFVYSFLDYPLLNCMLMLGFIYRTISGRVADTRCFFLIF